MSHIEAAAEGERIRLAEQLKRLRALIDGLESTVQHGGIPTSEAAQAVADTATRVVTAAGRLDAYQFAGASLGARRAPPIDTGNLRRSIESPPMVPPVQVSRPQFIGPGAPCPEGGGHAPNVLTRICRKCKQAV